MPKISIIMPVYNAQDFLQETIDSVLNQSIQDWELIAINDFSEDDSFKVLENYSQKDSRIQVFHNDQKGIIPGLEKAYSKTSGDYITRMDADDIMPVDKLENLANLIDQNPNACATGHVEYFSENQVFDGYKRYANWLNSLVDINSHYQDIYKECVVASPCWMMSRETLNKIGGITSNRYPEDYDLIFRLYQYEIPIVSVSKVLHLWRDHGSRASRNDENYADQSFLDLKIHYFNTLDYNKEKEVVLWGAGNAGKSIAKKLNEKNIPFRWITDNKKKIGLDIYNVTIEDMSILDNLSNAQIILAIKQKNFKEDNASFLQQLKSNNSIFPFF